MDFWVSSWICFRPGIIYGPQFENTRCSLPILPFGIGNPIKWEPISTWQMTIIWTETAKRLRKLSLYLLLSLKLKIAAKLNWIRHFKRNFTKEYKHLKHTFAFHSGFESLEVSKHCQIIHSQLDHYRNTLVVLFKWRKLELSTRIIFSKKLEAMLSGQISLRTLVRSTSSYYKALKLKNHKTLKMKSLKMFKFTP